MKVTRIQQSEIDEAITQLLKGGQYPNSANIRQLIGNRGSPPVLQRMIGEWYQKHGPALMADSASLRTIEAANAEQSIRDKLKAATAEALTTFESEIQVRENALEAQIQAHVQFEQMLKERKLKLEGRESAAAEQVRMAEERASKALAERDTALHSLELQKQACIEAQAALAHLQQKLVAAESQSVEQQRQVQQLMAQNQEWEQKHGALALQYENLKVAEKSLHAQAVRQAEETAKHKDEAASAQIMYAELKGAVEQERQQHQDLAGRLKVLQDEFSGMAKSNAQLELQIAEANNDLAKIRLAHQREIEQRDNTIKSLSDVRAMAATNDRVDQAIDKLMQWSEQFNATLNALQQSLKSNQEGKK